MKSTTHNHNHTGGGICAGDDATGKLRFSLVVVLAYVLVEALGGLFSGSLALLADAGHMFADAGGLGLALFAAWFACYPASAQKTYGYYRIEILAALLNSVVLIIMSIFISLEAMDRFNQPVAIQGGMMLLIALGGLVINILIAKTLHSHQHQNLNIKGAYLHVLGDLLGSIGAVIAGGCVLLFGWNWADPLISLVIAVLIAYSAVKLLIEAVNVLLEASPAHINVAGVQQAILALPGVQSLHDLHVWTITSGKEALSAHIVVDQNADHKAMLTCIQTCLRTEFNLCHTTLQLEPPDFESDEHVC